MDQEGVSEEVQQVVGKEEVKRNGSTAELAETVKDVMTSSGEVRAIGRHGVSGTKHSILARSAFEVTVSHLLRAGIIGERDERMMPTHTLKFLTCLQPFDRRLFFLSSLLPAYARWL